MSYCDLIQQEGEYNYSANIQFDIANDTKLARFIPNETTVQLLREYFVDVTRVKPEHHARILYGSYGTGKSHFLTVLSLILGKTHVEGEAYRRFIDRIRAYDMPLSEDIDAYVMDGRRKPFLVVPIVFDFEDFDRCIYFSLKKKLENIGRQISFKTFFDQALALLDQWGKRRESKERLTAACKKAGVNVTKLKRQLRTLDKSAEPVFQTVFKEMTFGVKYVYEVTNLEDAINQTNKAISDEYCGIVFIFDEFGRYIEDNAKSIKVKAIQDLAEFCDHCSGNNHIILVSHKEISQYTQRMSRNIANEWKKVEGRYKATPINDKQDQCLSLVRNVLVKNEEVWQHFSNDFRNELNQIYSDAADFRGFLIDVARGENPFESGFPLHPIALYALDKLSKKVAQNERTFFTYLASKDPDSLYDFLSNHDLNEFHFVGIDDIYDYFVPSIKSVQSDSSYEWYKELQAALSKNQSSEEDDSPEVRILKVISAIGIINDASTLTANKKTLLSVIDCPNDILSNALEALCERRIIKYSGSYDRYEFYEASIFDVDALLNEESRLVNNDAIVNALNEEFVNFVLYPYAYNHEYKMSRVIIPVFADVESFAKRDILRRVGTHYDGVLIMLLADDDSGIGDIMSDVASVDRAIGFVNVEGSTLKEAVKKYIALKFLESRKSEYTSKDPTFEKELAYFKEESVSNIHALIEAWKNCYDESTAVVTDGQVHSEIQSFADLADLGSKIVGEAYSEALIVNNELINKNSVSASMQSSRKNAVEAMLSGGNPQNYYGLTYLSPEYILIRSVLVKNGFIQLEDVEENHLSGGKSPQAKVKDTLQAYIEEAKEKVVEFADVYNTLKAPPYGLRDGYLTLLIAHTIMPYRKSLIVSSHGVEQELMVDLFEEIVRRPNDYSFTVASWSKDELEFMDALEQIFADYINDAMLSKNRLKAIYDAMLSHYRNVSKFARTTEVYVSEKTKKYRKLLEHSTTNYSVFLFKTLGKIEASYKETVDGVRSAKDDLDNAGYALISDLNISVCDLFEVPHNTPISLLISERYETDWKKKRNKPFDYYTNAFLEFASKIRANSDDYKMVLQLSRALTGFELLYWNDGHKEEFMSRLEEIKGKLDAYIVGESLTDSETRMTLTTASGQKKSVVFDRAELSVLGKTVKNKINSTFNNYGLAISYDDKVQILLSLIDELMEGK